MAAVEKSQSAPQVSRTHPRSKFLKAVTDKQQEISDWAKEGRPNIEFARQLGQLTENVTLDLMLHEHLFELSRARYKFKVNNRYEKKMFLQRQMTKSSALREKLKNVQIEDRRPKWAQGRSVSQQPSATQKELPQRPPATPAKRVRNSPPPPQRHKPDSAPMRRNPVLVTEEPRAQTRNSFYEPNQQRLSSPKGPKFFSTEPNFAPTKRQKTPTMDTQLKGMIITPVNKGSPREAVPRKDAVKLPPQIGPPPQTAPGRLRPDITSMDQSLNRPSNGRKKSRADHKAKLNSWALANRAVNEKRPVTDERYLKLERSLSDTYSGKTSTPNVNELVQLIGTLHAEPKRRTDRRPRVTAQVKAFLADSQGLSLKVF